MTILQKVHTSQQWHEVRIAFGCHDAFVLIRTFLCSIVVKPVSFQKRIVTLRRQSYTILHITYWLMCICESSVEYVSGMNEGFPLTLIYRDATTMCHVTYRHIKCFITWLVCFIFIFWVSLVDIEYNDFSYKCFTFLRFNPHIETNMWQVCYELAKASVSPPGLSSSLSRNTLSVLWQSYDCIMPLIRKIKITKNWPYIILES
jgi:hypothetical protein